MLYWVSYETSSSNHQLVFKMSRYIVDISGVSRYDIGHMIEKSKKKTNNIGDISSIYFRLDFACVARGCVATQNFTF